jgi:hypothetical protein
VGFHTIEGQQTKQTFFTTNYKNKIEENNQITPLRGVLLGAVDK